MGIPTVGLLGDSFLEDAKASSFAEGFRLRDIVVVHPFTDRGDAAEKKARSAMDQIIHGLTDPLTDEEEQTGTVEISLPRIALRGSLEEIQDYFRSNYWTDGLPILPPTEASVKKMLEGTSHPPEEIVGLVPPEKWRATVEGVAINGVMAGCKPEHLPVLLAMVEALSKEEFFFSTVRSTTSFSFMVLVNGPIAKKIGMNAGIGALGAGPFPNAAIGRALRLFFINLGGSRIGVNDLGALGSPIRYAFCFAENEEKSPWEPFHVEKGYQPEESTVTVFTGGWYLMSPGDLSTTDPDVHLRNLVKELKVIQYPTGAVILLTPMVAESLAKKGLLKKAVREYLWENASTTLGEWWQLEWISGFLEKQIGSHFPEWYGDPSVPRDKIVPLYASPEKICIVTAGEGTNPFHQTWSMVYPSIASVDRWR